MSNFKHLTDDDKNHFSEWIDHKVLNGFIHRLSAQQQALLLQNFAASVNALAQHPLFTGLQSELSTLEMRPYAEQECLQKVSELIKLLSLKHQQNHPDLSVMECLLFNENKVASFYTQLQLL